MPAIVQKVKLKDIVVTDRARVELGDDFEDLKLSISKRGQISPILINRKDMQLVAGFRRLTCHQQLGLKTIEAKFSEDLNSIEKKLFELEENIHLELTWDEKAKIRMDIHNLHQELHGAAKKGHKGMGWGMKNTADLLGVSESTIMQDQNLIEAINILPGIKEISSRRQALKSLDKTKEIMILTEIARREAESSQAHSTPYVLICGDSFKYIKENIDEETIDLSIFDPPWGIDAHRIATSRGPRGEKTSYKDDTEETAIDLTKKLLPELYRVMKEDAHMYMFIGIQYKDLYIDILTNFEKSLERIEIMKQWYPSLQKILDQEIQVLQEMIQARSWKFHVEEVPLIWVKEGGGFTDFENKFMPRYETILFCSKGKVKPLNEVCSNVLEYNRPLTTERIHTQEKPIALIDKLIKISTQPNQIVLDPCAGSFTTTMAATLLGRRSIAIDNDKVCHAKGLARISGLVDELEEEEK